MEDELDLDDIFEGMEEETEIVLEAVFEETESGGFDLGSLLTGGEVYVTHEVGDTAEEEPEKVQVAVFGVSAPEGGAAEVAEEGDVNPADEWDDEPEAEAAEVEVSVEPRKRDKTPIVGSEEDDDELEPVEERVFERPGLTGEVSSFGSVDQKYPCVILEDGFIREKHKMSAMVAMLAPVTGADKPIEVYAHMGEDLLACGSLAKTQVKHFIRLMGTEGIDFYMNKDLKLEGDLVYILAG